VTHSDLIGLCKVPPPLVTVAMSDNTHTHTHTHTHTMFSCSETHIVEQRTLTTH